jgi:hypothetical protein
MTGELPARRPGRPAVREPSARASDVYDKHLKFVETLYLATVGDR